MTGTPRSTLHPISSLPTIHVDSCWAIWNIEYCRNANSWAIFWNIKHGTEWPGWVCLMCISFPAPISLCLYVCFLQSHGKLNAVSNLCHHKIVSALIFSLFQMFSTVWQLNQNLLMPNLWHHKLVSALIRVVLAVCAICHER